MTTVKTMTVVSIANYNELKAKYEALEAMYKEKVSAAKEAIARRDARLEKAVEVFKQQKAEIEELKSTDAVKAEAEIIQKRIDEVTTDFEIIIIDKEETIAHLESRLEKAKDVFLQQKEDIKGLNEVIKHTEEEADEVIERHREEIEDLKDKLAEYETQESQEQADAVKEAVEEIKEQEVEWDQVKSCEKYNRMINDCVCGTEKEETVEKEQPIQEAHVMAFNNRPHDAHVVAYQNKPVEEKQDMQEVFTAKLSYLKKAKAVNRAKEFVIAVKNGVSVDTILEAIEKRMTPAALNAAVKQGLTLEEYKATRKAKAKAKATKNAKQTIDVDVVVGEVPVAEFEEVNEAEEMSDWGYKVGMNRKTNSANARRAKNRANGAKFQFAEVVA